MPYIVTTHVGPPLTHHDGGAMIRSAHVVRRAVATLDEARQEAITIMSADAPGWDDGGWTPPAEYVQPYTLAYNLPDTSPILLPDGTVIEVERVEWDALALNAYDASPDPHEAYMRDTFGDDFVPPDRNRMIDAYNAAQEGETR